MLNVAVLGGGGHCRGNHLPALNLFRTLYPGRIQLSAFCDLDPQTAEQIAREYGFLRYFTDLQTMLEQTRIDAFIAVTPVSITARVAAIVLSAGIAMLMEKPPGATPAEVDGVCELVDRLGSRAMVSMNRRFDPAVVAARAWLGSRPLQYLRASMLRDNRTESGFITDTAIHCIDTVRHLAGNIRDFTVRARRVNGVLWYWVDLAFESGAGGLIEIMPTCGCLAETYELYAADCRVIARVAEFDIGTMTAWEKGRIAHDGNPTEALPPGYVRNGTYAETEAFLSGVESGGALFPTPADVRPSVEICRAIQTRAVIAAP